MVKDDAVQYSEVFIAALRGADKAGLALVPKSDYHNHGCLGYPLDVLRRRSGVKIPDPPEAFDTFPDFITYLVDHLHPHLYTRAGFEFSIDAALKHAVGDGIRVVELSIDAQMMEVYEDAQELVEVIVGIADENPDVTLFPEIGINRMWPRELAESRALPMIRSGLFESIDLYGSETDGNLNDFSLVYAEAAEHGLLRKAHAGEYRDAEFVQRSVEELGLDEVQHGISAACSEEVMDWLIERGVVLHICPTSNVRLKRVSSLELHPMRKLFDHGVALTINSDDIMVFGQSVSDEYLNLYQSGLFNAEELDRIRVFGLNLRE